MRLDRLPAELRVIPRAALVTPPVAALAAVAVGGTGAALHVTGDAGTLVSVGVEMCVPAATGMAAAALAAADPGLELQLTTRTPYRRVVLLRLGLVVGWTAALMLVAGAAAAPTGAWPSPALPWRVPAAGAWWLSQLAWLAPLLWFTAWGAGVAVGCQSWPASAAVLGSIWLGQMVFYRSFVTTPLLRPAFLFATTFSPNAGFWLGNRLELLLGALAPFAATWWLLGGRERLLRGAEAGAP